MKTNKFFAGLLMVAAFAMVGCEEKKNNEIIIGGGGTDSTEVATIPELDAPADGQVTIVINIPAGSECNGIRFKGSMNGADWSGADTYVGLESAAVSADEAVKFEPVPEFENWYAATFNLGEPNAETGVCLQGKVCLVYTNDGSWEGQASDWTVDDVNTSAPYNKADNLEIKGTGLVYITIGGWQKSECVVVEPEDYTVSVTLAEGATGIPCIIGDAVGGWSDHIQMAEANGVYTHSFTAKPGDQFKITFGGWDAQEAIFASDYNAESECYAKQSNQVLETGKNTIAIEVVGSQADVTICAE